MRCGRRGRRADRCPGVVAIKDSHSAHTGWWPFPATAKHPVEPTSRPTPMIEECTNVLAGSPLFLVYLLPGGLPHPLLYFEGMKCLPMIGHNRALPLLSTTSPPGASMSQPHLPPPTTLGLTVPCPRPPVSSPPPGTLSSVGVPLVGFPEKGSTFGGYAATRAHMNT